VANLSLYLNTLRYLKRKQIWHQIYYRITGIRGPRKLLKAHKSGTGLTLANPILAQYSYLGEQTFSFLNLSHKFTNSIDWNYAENGKLWTYNLTYFEFLNQPGMPTTAGVKLMADFVRNYSSLQDAHEPYPTSLRVVNWIKFLGTHQQHTTEFDAALCTDLLRLSKNVEYHLMGNHLLENGFALLWGGLYFDEVAFTSQGQEILREELTEQIEVNGAHFEYAPMYHCILLGRLLETIDLMATNGFEHLQNFEQFLREKASAMLSWLEKITLNNGQLLHFNDSTKGIAPASQALFDKAKQLNIRIHQGLKNASKHFFIQTPKYHLFIDGQEIYPDYIPGHAHDGLYHFLLQINNHPFIVDTGISTYEKNARRHYERSAMAHNTVTMQGEGHAEMWGGFRVGNRSESIVMDETHAHLSFMQSASNGIGLNRLRDFTWDSSSITLEEELIGSSTGTARFHFHPAVIPELNGNVLKTSLASLTFEGFSDIRLEQYQYAEGFNTTKEALVAVVAFSHKMTTTITVS